MFEQKQKQYRTLQNAIVDDSHCIESLQSVQGQVQHAETVYNATCHAYSVSHSDDLLEAVWGTKDTLDKFMYDYYMTQKKCGPDTVQVPEMPAPSVCEQETGGTCKFLWCDASRNAYCDQATSSCRCPPTTCAIGGSCQSRGPPPCATLDEPAMPELAETPAGGNLKIIFVVAFAMLLGMAAAAVPKRSGSRNVVLSEELLK